MAVCGQSGRRLAIMPINTVRCPHCDARQALDEISLEDTASTIDAEKLLETYSVPDPNYAPLPSVITCKQERSIARVPLVGPRAMVHFAQGFLGERE
jgi:hypothetical protein